MVRITFVSSDNSKQELQADEGLSIMEVAINNCIDAIVAECGGACACATCHCYVDEKWLSRLPQMDDMEDCMLDAAMNRKPNSRLSCQIKVTKELDGLTLVAADNSA